MAQGRDYLGGFIYYSDIIFAIIFAFYFFTGLYGFHFLTHEGFKHYILSSGHLFEKIVFYVSMFALVLYLYFIPYALWRKSKKPWISKFCCNINVYVLIALVSFYLIVYWSGNFGYFTREDISLLSDAKQLFFLVFLFFTTAFAFEGAIEIYLTHPVIYEIEEEERMRRMEARKKAQQQKNVQQQKPQPKPQQHPQPKQSVQMEIKERLRRLKELWDEGLITEEDYKRKKEEILKEL